jgi:hypothetical protein
MTKITQLPVVNTMADQSVFVVVDNGVTKKLSYTALKSTLKGDKGETGETGAKGDTGLQGEKGDKGETGSQGPVGPLAPFSTATDIRLGGIKIGTGLNVTGDGTLSVPIVTINTASISASGTIIPGLGLKLVDGVGTTIVSPRLYLSVAEEFTVGNSASSGYTFEGYTGQNPSITLVPGATYSWVFKSNPGEHPWQVRAAPGGNAITEGRWWFVSNNGTITEGGALANIGRDNGTLFWTVPRNPAQYVYYYQCTFHPGMLGAINIKNESQIFTTNVNAYAGAVTRDVLPDTDSSHDLGSDTKRWKSIFLSGNSIDLGGVVMSVNQQGKIGSTGGFDTGKSITNVSVIAGGSFITPPVVKINDPTGKDFDSTVLLTPTTVNNVDILINPSVADITGAVTVELSGSATADAVLDYYLDDLQVGYRTTPTAVLVINQAVTLNAQATLQIADDAQAVALKNFLDYQALSEQRDGLPTFIDPSVARLKTLKILDVDVPSRTITFDPSLSRATIPAAVYSFSVPTITIADGAFPIVCNGYQIGKVVSKAGAYSAYIADRLDTNRLPNGARAGDFIDVTCTGLTGQPGFFFLSSVVGNSQINKVKVRYGLVGITVTDPGQDYITPPTVTVKIDGVASTPLSVNCFAKLTATPAESVTVLNFGAQYTEAAAAILQSSLSGPSNTVPNGNNNLWKVTTDLYPLSVTRTAGQALYVYTTAELGNGQASNAVQTISQGMTVQSLTNPGSTPGTVVSVVPVWSIKNGVRLYRVNMSASSSASADDVLNFAPVASSLSIVKDVAKPTLPATDHTLGTIIAGSGLAVDQSGILSVTKGSVDEQFTTIYTNTVRFAKTAPTTSKGSVVDVTGMVAFSSAHVYYCAGNYDGTTNIWKRTAWTQTSW